MRGSTYFNLSILYLVGTLSFGSVAAIMFLLRLAKLAAAAPKSDAAREILKNEGFYGAELAIMLAFGIITIISFIFMVGCVLLFIRESLTEAHQPQVVEPDNNKTKPAETVKVIEGKVAAAGR